VDEYFYIPDKYMNYLKNLHIGIGSPFLYYTYIYIYKIYIKYYI